MFRSRVKKTGNGFTLIEVLVVVGIVSILAAVIAVNSIQSGRQGRDAKRQADIRSLQSAVELYKNKYGRYPAGCRGADTWSGQQGSSYACSGGNTQYIVNLAPEFLPVLPVDTKRNSAFANSGYMYRTNAAGTVYKIMAMNTVEGELVNYNHALKSCDIRPDSLGRLQNLGASGVETSGWCTTATLAAREPSGVATSYGLIAHCRMSTGINASDGGDGRFERSYGVWGGFLPLATGPNRAAEVRDTAAIICK